MDKTANIIGWDNGGGLSRDMDVLSRELRQSGWTVAFNGRAVRARGRTLLARALGRARAQVGKRLARRPGFEFNFHLEEINAEFLPMARRNVLIPNQEWIRDESFPHLATIDEVWVKTHLAERLFSDLGCKVRFLGWTGSDRRMPKESVTRTLTGLHIAGSSLWKGTEAVLDVWSEHPEWPVLKVLRRTHGYEGGALPWRPRSLCPNIQLFAHRIDEESLVRLQNACAVHICPSEAEGFGHIILESMSVEAAIITTDAPPMNEMITDGCGLLAAVERSEPMSLGRRYFVSRGALAQRIGLVLSMSDHERESLGLAARARFEANNASFRVRLVECLESAG